LTACKPLGSIRGGSLKTHAYREKSTSLSSRAPLTAPRGLSATQVSPKSSALTPVVAMQEGGIDGKEENP